MAALPIATVATGTPFGICSSMAQLLRTALYVIAGSVGMSINTDDSHPVSMCLCASYSPRGRKILLPIRGVKCLYGVIREGTLEAVLTRRVLPCLLSTKARGGVALFSLGHLLPMSPS